MSGSIASAVGGNETLRGTVRALNFAPKGEVAGWMVEVEGTIVQVNIPPDQADLVRDRIGREVEVEVGPEPKVADHPTGDHRVYKIVAGADQSKRGPGAGGPGHKPPHPPEHAVSAEVTGHVQRLNYAKHGEANGVVLDTGDFVHLKPDGMKQVGLQVGQPVTARGKGRPTATGGKAIDAEVVNGMELGPKKPH